MGSTNYSLPTPHSPLSTTRLPPTLLNNPLPMAEEHKKPEGNQLNIELPEDIAEGVYSNLAIISHSNSEFVVDFVRIVPNAPKAKVKSRVILTPEHAKRLLAALNDNIKKYEKQFGSIGSPGGNTGNKGPNFPPMSFTPTAQA